MFIVPAAYQYVVCLSVQGDADVPLSEVEGEDESPDYSYRLVCVIMHQGASPNCGGYPCYVHSALSGVSQFMIPFSYTLVIVKHSKLL
jgi:hypothetical protein